MQNYERKLDHKSHLLSAVLQWAGEHFRFRFVPETKYVRSRHIGSLFQKAGNEQTRCQPERLTAKCLFQKSMTPTCSDAALE